MPMRVELPVSFVVDITAVFDVKREAILAHASQVGTPVAGGGPLIGSALALAAIEARDRYHGAMIGVAAAEPYCVEAALGISDPVTFFRDTTHGPAHLFPRRLP
jgi:LmbE family N-acetylglucosaminyl deacetylase